MKSVVLCQEEGNGKIVGTRIFPIQIKDAMDVIEEILTHNTPKIEVTLCDDRFEYDFDQTKLRTENFCTLKNMTNLVKLMLRINN